MLETLEVGNMSGYRYPDRMQDMNPNLQHTYCAAVGLKTESESKVGSKLVTRVRSKLLRVPCILYTPRLGCPIPHMRSGQAGP